jgi:hypothetical protein
VEKEQGSNDRRDEAPEEIAASDVCDFMADYQGPFRIAESAQRRRRQDDGGPENADQHRTTLPVGFQQHRWRAEPNRPAGRRQFIAQVLTFAPATRVPQSADGTVISQDSSALADDDHGPSDKYHQ